MRWSLGRNAFWLWLKGGLIVYFHVRSCSLSNDAVKSRTCFPKNMYDFLQKHVRVFQKSQSCFFKVLILSNLYICAICIPYCILLLPRRNTHCLYKSG
ncbi:hypothetical protein BDI_2607 [Parabacteroides distasonis ATCC 8503]|uniref:Uncharacterized protein n=1 Tax=Parabacteroides distasonis (strain ATCC 8503 / DSM 20701 / CIP 104284 / JCM 5825 / NCTC 11152) TaxID=435591 RepID=A6LF62_PARD8|nr:hypothetical protein BDI_2607 [Parabacteroides distasonis ATCC 8503]PNL07478.1 hypothetical protein CEQ22_005060 [Parabacteroides distasonis]